MVKIVLTTILFYSILLIVGKVLKYKISKGGTMSAEMKNMSNRLIAIFENIMKIEHESILQEYGEKISIAEIHTIAAIGNENLCSMSEVAGKLHITVGTLTVAISNLVRKGYVERYKSEKDRRIVKLGLTKQGKEVYQIHNEFHERLVQYLTRDLTEEEKNVVKKALMNIEQFIEQGYRELEIIQG